MSIGSFATGIGGFRKQRLKIRRAFIPGAVRQTVGI
jgi:hypothetical protein